MGYMKLYAVAVVVAGLVLVPTAAHAEKVWVDPGNYGFDCELESHFTVLDGAIHHFPALAYEIESYCGVPATIVWTDAQLNGAPLFVEPLHAAPAAPVAPAPVVAPAAVTVPVAVETVAPPAAPRWGHYLRTRAI